MEFEFVDTVESREFFSRNPLFFAAFENLVSLGNKCLGRENIPKSRLEDVCFSLSHTCREDFFEVTFLAVNGYGNGALKALRGLYERAVTIAYIIDKPERAERFIRYAAIQEHRALEAALKVVSEEDFDTAMKASSVSAAQIRKIYAEVKEEFQTTICRKCETKRTSSNWDIDFASMVHHVGQPYSGFYLGAYTLPNFKVHATPASGLNDMPAPKRREESRKDSELALFLASLLLINVMKSQNALFLLGIDSELEACEQKLISAWQAAAPPTG